MTRILQLTDLHVFRQPGERLKGIPTLESLKDVVDHIRNHEPEFDHVVVTGDHTHDELEESYAAVASVLGEWRDRLWLVPGNHDDRRLLRATFVDRIDGQPDDLISFQFNAGKWLCIGVDSHDIGEVGGRFTDDQAESLRRNLKDSVAESVALFLHHPPVDIGSVWMDQIGLSGREHLANVVAEDRRIQLIVCGHVHHDFQSTLHQAAVVATPSTGIQFEPDAAEPSFAAAAAGYRVIEFSGSQYHTKVVRLSEIKYVPDV